ncbi:hypothetical protein [Cutibacterium modestum]|uniref:hypothetical protein n=1 Tax=Cutibacterium modestum TaxID=2559073 RepID=UPI0020A4BB80|nr:hypothetical protein [Cutibacterium modestum]
MERPLAASRHRSKWRYTNSRRLQAVRVILTIVVSISSIVLLVLGIAAWSLPETEDIHLISASTVHLQKSPPLSQGQVVFVSKDIGLDGTGPDSALSCSITRESSTSRVTAPADPSIGERAREDTALRSVLRIGATHGDETLHCSGTAAESGAVWVMPVRVGVPFRALVATVAGIGLLGLALIIHFGRLLDREG